MKKYYAEKRTVLKTSIIFIVTLLLATFSKAHAQANITLTGLVLDDGTQLPLSGATVHIKGTTHEVITDDAGRFGFLTGQHLPVTYIVSYVGYQTAEVTVREGSSSEIRLHQTSNQLSDVVVMGYGRQRRSDVTGAVAQIPSKLLNQPVSSVEQLLKGAAAGVQVTQTSGQPGGGVSIRIRGGSSIQGGNEPLYVIDGFPVYNSAATAGVLSGTATNPLADINPADIESITVLKDASSTAIYGSRGANGVIIVTTKRGRTDRNTITYDASYGVQSLRKKIDLLNAQQFAELRNEVLYDVDPTKGQYQYLSQEQINQLGKGTDWQDAAFRNAGVQNHQLSISGGNAKTRYSLSGNFFNQDGIIRHTDFQRLSGRANLDIVASNRFKISTNVTASNTTANVVPTGIVSSLLIMPPTATIYEADGSYTLRNPFENIFSNPIAALNEQTNKVSGL